MPETDKPEILRFIRDMTLRWSCRRGDFLLWMRFANVFTAPRGLKIVDLWEMRDGDFVTITNRLEDLPAWFELHPTEVCNALAYKMMAKLGEGYQARDPLDGPNIWRLRAGDRVAWVGAERPDRRPVDGVLAILDCYECALALGESNLGGINEFMDFGSPSTASPRPEDSARGRAAVKVVQQLGIPNTWAAGWWLG